MHYKLCKKFKFLPIIVRYKINHDKALLDCLRPKPRNQDVLGSSPVVNPVFVVLFRVQ